MKEEFNVKKFVAFALALVLILSLASTALAAKPLAKVYSHTKTAYAGYSAYYYIRLQSKSFSYLSGYGKNGYRSCLEADIHYKKKNGTEVAYWSDLYWSGNGYKTYKWSIPSYRAAGKYFFRYKTWFYDYYWRVARTQWVSTRVKR